MSDEQIIEAEVVAPAVFALAKGRLVYDGRYEFEITDMRFGEGMLVVTAECTAEWIARGLPPRKRELVVYGADGIEVFRQAGINLGFREKNMYSLVVTQVINLGPL